MMQLLLPQLRELCYVGHNSGELCYVYHSSFLMRRIIFILIGLLFIFTNCGSDSALEKSIGVYAKDNKISEAEWNRLTQLIQANLSKYTKEGLVENGDIQIEALQEYVQNMAGKPLTFDVLKNPRIKDEGEEVTPGSTVYNVYIENSGSMDGYVKGLTSFKNTVYQFLSDLQSPLRNITKEANLFYINSKAIPFREDTKAFIEKLDPATFKQRGGNRKQTDVNNILDTIFQRAPASAVNILITDGVFSPGRDKDPIEYLVSQSIGIKNVFEKQLNRRGDLTTVVVKLNSTFNGIYYDYRNKKHSLSDTRPYYIWIMGPAQAVQNLLSQLNLKQLNGMENVHYFVSQNNSPDYRVLFKKRIGQIKRDRDDPLYTIVGAEKETRGDNAGYFQFALGVDLGAYGLDESYLTNPRNYRLSNMDYQITIEAIPEQEARQDRTLEGLTHYFLLKTEDLKTEKLEIELLKNTPYWVQNASSTDDRTQEGDELSKTFGLQYMVEGVEKAYAAATKEQASFFNLSVNIKR